MKSDDLLITGQQAAQLIGVSPPTFYKMSREYKLLSPVPSAGNGVVWSLKSVLEYIDRKDELKRFERDALVEKFMGAIDEREDVERRR